MKRGCGGQKSLKRCEIIFEQPLILLSYFIPNLTLCNASYSNLHWLRMSLVRLCVMLDCMEAKSKIVQQD